MATEIKKFEKRDLAQAVIGVGVMVDFISRIMSVLADSWGCWCGLPIDEKTSNYLACYLQHFKTVKKITIHYVYYCLAGGIFVKKCAVW